MIFIIGGAYQGKLDYAKDHYKIGSICDCTDGREPDLSCDAICGIAGYVMDCVKTGDKEAADFFRAHRQELKDKILINTDVSMGIVPMDKKERAFREMNGRTNIYLTSIADDVIEVFCGLGKSMTKRDSVV